MKFAKYLKTPFMGHLPTTGSVAVNCYFFSSFTDLLIYFSINICITRLIYLCYQMLFDIHILVFLLTNFFSEYERRPKASTKVSIAVYGLTKTNFNADLLQNSVL